MPVFRSTHFLSCSIDSVLFQRSSDSHRFLRMQTGKNRNRITPAGSPLWKDGVGLLFSDIKRNLIDVWSPSDGSVKPWLQPSDSSNGITLIGRVDWC